MVAPKSCACLPRHLLSVLLCLLAGGCALKSSTPNLPRIYHVPVPLRQTGKNPVIIIPGILGSQLVNQKTGEVVWPRLTQSMGDSIALPINSPRLSDNRDNLIASEIIVSAQLLRFTPEISVYNSLLKALAEQGGYRRGNLNAPETGGDRDTFYVFPYDWRRDNVESARLLLQSIVRLKEQLGRPDLRFDIVAHSMGGLVARYCAMYGDRDVLNGTGEPQPDWAGARHFARLVMVGTPNAGSMDALGSILDGYSIFGSDLPRVRLFNKLNADAVFTIPSVYQLLPHGGSAQLLDERLSPVGVDIFDAATWKRFAWSIAYNEDFQMRERKRRFKQLGLDEAGEESRQLTASRERFLQTVLTRARQFHRALDAASTPPPALRTYLFGGDCEPTLNAVVVTTVKGRQVTLFRVAKLLGDREARHRASEAMFSPGDGRVTRRSLFGLVTDGDAATRVPSLANPVQATFECELHSDLPLNPTVIDNLLTLLLGNRF